MMGNHISISDAETPPRTVAVGGTTIIASGDRSTDVPHRSTNAASRRSTRLRPPRRMMRGASRSPDRTVPVQRDTLLTRKEPIRTRALSVSAAAPDRVVRRRQRDVKWARVFEARWIGHLDRATKVFSRSLVTRADSVDASPRDVNREVHGPSCLKVQTGGTHGRGCSVQFLQVRDITRTPVMNLHAERDGGPDIDARVHGDDEFPVPGLKSVSL
jgi:hypothetical protein